MGRASNKLWTLILALTLMVGGTVAMPGHVRADYAGELGGPSVPPDPQAGDPDWPDGKVSMPKPGATRGVARPVSGAYSSARMGFTAKWMWSFRVAFTTVYRAFFRA